MGLVSNDEEERIARAITAAESKTAGEIVAIIAADSGSYLYAPFLWAAVLALLVPWPLIYLTWTSVQSIYLVQLAVFLCLLAALLPPRVRPFLVPAPVKRSRAHRRAVEQFLAQSLHTTKGRTGVLIFVSVAERYAEVIADSAIEARVPKGTWQEVVDDLTRHIASGHAGDGFVTAIEAVGRHLARHFPPGSRDENELANHLIVLP